MGHIDVRPAGKADIRELSHTLSRAFFEDPVMTWLLPDAGRRAKGMPKFFAALTRYQFLPSGVVEVAFDGGQMAAGDLWAPPGHWETPTLTGLRMVPSMLRAFGPNVMRGQRVDDLMKREHPEEPHWYLAVIGSDPTFRGAGYGHAVLSSQLDRVDAEHAPAYLESSNPDNIPYYERFGFEVTGELVLPDDGPKLWPMWRQPR